MCGKVIRRLVPLIMLLFLVNTLDRVNIAFAALQMNDALGFTASIYGWGAGIFFLGYFVFEVPSNLVLARVGARIWIARIIFTWGIVSCGMAFVNSPSSFYVMRFLLGVAEAGFVPGILFYLGTWLPKRYLGRAIGLMTIAVTVTIVIGAPLSTWIMTMSGMGGLAGWQWLFMLEGLPAVLLTIAVLRYLTNTPAEAKWLTEQERSWLIERLKAERTSIESSVPKHTAWQALGSPRVLSLSAVYFFVVIGLYGVGFWVPQIVRRAGFSLMETGLVSAIPYVFAALGAYYWGKRSDLLNERRWHLVAATSVACVGLAISGLVQHPGLAVAALCLAATGIYGAIPVFQAMPHTFLTGTNAAVAIAVINSIGNLGGFTGPFLVGWLREKTGGFQVPLLVMAASLFIAALLAIIALKGNPRTESPRKYPHAAH